MGKSLQHYSLSTEQEHAQSIGKMTFEEAFTRKKPEIGHLCIFGYLVYCHVPVEKRTKIEPIAVKGIFTGYKGTEEDNGAEGCEI